MGTTANPRVFILEDDPAIAFLLKDVFEKQSWEIAHVAQTREAMPAIRRLRPDIMLLDVNLPDGDGFDVCRQVHQDSVLSKIPVIFMTSKGDIPSRLKGFEAGAQDYIIKPFDLRELMARVCAHLAIKRDQDQVLHEKEELQLRDRLREDMMGMIVHDLRTPLSTIKVTLEMYGMKGLLQQVDYDMAIKSAEHAADWAILMVNDLLDLSSGKLSITHSPLHLRKITDRLRNLFHTQLEHRRIHLNVDIPTEGHQASTDTTLLLRILLNILSNAVKFSPSQSAITLRARLEDEKLRIEVADRGPGIPDAEKDKVFLKYYRIVVPGTQVTIGNGIGLAFCRLAADALGGRIWVENRLGGGSCFKLEIPVLSQIPA